MSQVDYDQKIREINSLKISDAEKSRRIRILLLQRKQAYESKVMKAVSKTVVKMVEKPLKVDRHVRENNVEKQSKIQALIANEPETTNVASIQASVDRIRQIHAIRRQNLNPHEKIVKIQALIKKSEPIVRVLSQRAMNPIKEKIISVHKENISLDEKKIKIEALLKERRAA